MAVPTTQQSGADTIPVTYVNPVTQLILVDVDEDHVLTQNTVTRTTPTFAPIDIRGSSTEYTRQVNAFGTVNIKITRTNISAGGSRPMGISLSPPYIDVWYNGIWYKILADGKTSVTVPRCVYDVIQASQDYAAKITS